MTSLCRDCLKVDGSPLAPCPTCGSRRVLSHPELMDLSIAHLDCDAFYASVEKRDDPTLRDKPVIVGGGKRGVVTTACYIARLSGARSAMPMFKALKLCPDAVVIKPNFAKYKTESRAIMARLEALTPLVQPLSLDEAWIDLSGTERLHGAPPAVLLARVQAQIEREQGLTVSIGLAPNKFLAKIASDLDKPRGFFAIGAAGVADFLAPKPVGILPGVGPAFVKALEAAGYRTVGDLARADQRTLADRFGANGLRLHNLAHGRDARAVDPDQGRKTISAETTFEHDLSSLADLEAKLGPLCDRVARQAREGGIAGRVAVLKLRASDFRILTRRRTLAEPIQTGRTLLAALKPMLAKELGAGAWRLIGAGLTDFVDAEMMAQDLFGGDERRTLKAEQAMDTLRARFGPAALVRGRALGDGRDRS